MREGLFYSAMTGVLFYLILTGLDALNIVVAPRWPSGLLAGFCAALVFWIGPKLKNRWLRNERP
ncbi:MAG: hypothetical protein V4475_07455 [Pseudomonadota bacterium]